MTTLDLPQRSYQRPVIHVDDLGRTLDRARILLDSSIRELSSVAHITPDAEGLAAEISQIKARLVKAWEELEEPTLPF
jgi:hypothetical protein